MSVLEFLLSPFVTSKKPILSYGVVLPKYYVNGQLHYPTPETKLGYLVGDGLMWASLYQVSKHFGVTLWDSSLGKVVTVGLPVVSIVGYLMKRRKDHQTRQNIRTILSRNNAHNYYQSVLPDRSIHEKSFDVIFLDQKENLDANALLKATINNGYEVHLDYYPKDTFKEQMPHLKNPVRHLEVNHFNSGVNDQGWLSFPPHLYPDLKILKLSTCGIPLKMKYSALESLQELEMRDVVLENGWKYYWDKFPSLKHFMVIYDNSQFTEGISLDKDQSLQSLTLGFSHKFTKLSNQEHHKKNTTLLQDLPSTIDELCLENLVMSETYDFGKTEIRVLVLSKCKLNPGWNIKGNIEKILLEKSQVCALPKLDAKPELIGGYCLDLDQIQIVDLYWYQYKFFWPTDPPILSIETAQKYLDQGLLKITFPDDLSASVVSTDDPDFDDAFNSYGVLQTVGDGNCRLYQAHLPKNDAGEFKQLENLVFDNGDILINDRRMELARIMENKHNHLKDCVKDAISTNS